MGEGKKKVKELENIQKKQSLIRQNTNNPCWVETLTIKKEQKERHVKKKDDKKGAQERDKYN